MGAAPAVGGGLHRDAVRVLQDWVAPDPQQEALRVGFLAFLVEHPDGTYRRCVPRHVTASALVVDAAHERALLTLHAKGGFWAQTGGHCEDGDASLGAVALREASEESGVDGLRLLGPVDLDLHGLSAAFGTCRSHLDVRYAAVAPAGAEPVRSGESRDLRWFDLAALGGGRAAPPAGGTVVDLRRLAAAAARALAVRPIGAS